MRVLVIGEAPSRWMHERGITDPLPLAGKELANMAGVAWPNEWFAMFEPVNVLDEWPGKQGKGDAFPLTLARARAHRMVEGFDGRRVVMLGQRVQSAFCLDQDLFEWTDVHAATINYSIATCPHPSHVNRWWNDPVNRQLARQFWMELAREARCASAG